MTSLNRFQCLVVDPSGNTYTTLTNGFKSFLGKPDYKCEKIDCPIRTKCRPGEIGAAYRPLGIKLGKIDDLYGVVLCEGGGSAQRRLP